MGIAADEVIGTYSATEERFWTRRRVTCRIAAACCAMTTGWRWLSTCAG